jgi:hypothetical protein
VEEINVPPPLGLCRAVVIAPTYLKTNRPEAELVEDRGTSQSTISHAITGITPWPNKVLAELAPTADELDPQSQHG